MPYEPATYRFRIFCPDDMPAYGKTLQLPSQNLPITPFPYLI